MLKILSILLSYPQDAWLLEVPQIQEYVEKHNPKEAKKLKALFEHLQKEDSISLQESYVNTFDRNSSHSLHLFEHLHGEDRERGQAMVDLLNTYQAQGLEPSESELPDYLPLFLEFLSQMDQATADAMLADAVHVINYIAGNLEKNESIYLPILQILVAMSLVKPEPLQVAPVRDMDEAMEMFGPNSEGIEPLLQANQQSTVQPVQFYPSGKKC